MFQDAALHEALHRPIVSVSYSIQACESVDASSSSTICCHEREMDGYKTPVSTSTTILNNKNTQQICQTQQQSNDAITTLLQILSNEGSSDTSQKNPPTATSGPIRQQSQKKLPITPYSPRLRYSVRQRQDATYQSQTNKVFDVLRRADGRRSTVLRCLSAFARGRYIACVL